MPGGTNRPIVSDRDRFALLERELSGLKLTVANLQRPKPRTHWLQVRLAETKAVPPVEEEGDPVYPSGEAERFPIVFLDVAYDPDTTDVTYTPKSDAPQAYAIALEPTVIEEGTKLYVRQAENGLWTILEVDPRGAVRIAETDSGGIAAGGSATVSELNMDGTAREDDESVAITYTAYNVFEGAVGGSRRILTLPWRHDIEKEIVIAEDCPEEET